MSASLHRIKRHDKGWGSGLLDGQHALVEFGLGFGLPDLAGQGDGPGERTVGTLDTVGIVLFLFALEFFSRREE